MLPLTLLVLRLVWNRIIYFWLGGYGNWLNKNSPDCPLDYPAFTLPLGSASWPFKKPDFWRHSFHSLGIGWHTPSGRIHERKMYPYRHVFFFLKKTCHEVAHSILPVKHRNPFAHMSLTRWCAVRPLVNGSFDSLTTAVFLNNYVFSVCKCVFLSGLLVDHVCICMLYITCLFSLLLTPV